MKGRQKRNNHIWKILFFFTLALNLLFISVLGFIIYPIVKPLAEQEEEYPKPSLSSSDTPIYMHATKENVSELLESFLMSEDDDESFTILLDNDLHFLTDASLFGIDIPLHARFEPIVEPNGNLTLKQSSISFGMLQIPNEYALKYIANTFDTPNWVYIRPYEEVIYLDLNAAQIGAHYFVKVQQFDLANDEIIFELHMMHD